MERVTALTCIAAVIACMGIAFGDTGPSLMQYRIFWALAIAIAGKLATLTGAWPGRARRAFGPGPSGPLAPTGSR
jgi:hypothetical protein